MLPCYEIFTKTYAEKRNEGLLNCSNLDEWEYSHYNLTFPDGYTQDEREIEITTRRGNTWKLVDDPHYL
jgi:hypothetical protein